VAVYTFPPAVKLTVGSPSIKVAYLYGEPRDLVVASPVISRATLHQRFAFFVGQVEIETDWQDGDPEVWVLNRLKVDPEDGSSIKEALHSNHNDELLFECDGQSLVGRSEIERGAAHKITTQLPLYLEDHTLKLNTAGLGGGPGGGGIPEAPLSSQTYGRINATWARVLAINNDILDGGNF
jgi:hypothetical protein